MKSSEKPLGPSGTYRAGIVYSTFFSFLAKLSRFALYAAIAFYFGANVDTDVYFFVFFTFFLISAFLDAANPNVLVPELMRIREHESETASREFANFFLQLLVVFCALLTLVFWLVPIPVFDAISQFDTETLLDHRDLLRAGAPLLLVTALSAHLTAILGAHRIFSLPPALNLLSNLIVIAVIITGHATWGLVGVMVAEGIGGAVRCVILLWTMKAELQWKFFRVSRCRDAKVWKDLVYVRLGSAATNLALFVPVWILSGYPNGIVAALHYAQRIAELPQTLIVGQFVTVAGVRLNELWSQQKAERFVKIFSDSVRFLVFVTVPISAILFLFPGEIIGVVFERGEFTGQMVLVSTEMLRWLGLFVPLAALNTIVSGVFLAGRRVGLSIGAQAAASLVSAVAIWLAVDRFGYLGYPWAFCGVFLVYVTAGCYIMIRCCFPEIDYGRLLVYSALVVVVNMGLMVMIYILPGLASLSNLVRLMVGGGDLWGGAAWVEQRVPD